MTVDALAAGKLRKISGSAGALLDRAAATFVGQGCGSDATGTHVRLHVHAPG